MNNEPLSRRDLIKGTAVLAGSVLLPKSGRSSDAPSPTAGHKHARGGGVSGRAAVASTTAGRIRGTIRNNITTFLGVPYGASTGGDARFLKARKPQPWAGIRSALAYGPVCPQSPQHYYVSDDESAFVLDPIYGPIGEDCLRLNIWTPGLDTSRRPVLVWLHGGGFSGWSGQYLSSFHGENLSRIVDAVVVAVNHRIGVLGCLNVSGIGGEAYAASGNNASLDLVAALEWVRDNIAQFGGDPGNVTIFGQSGGGGKVRALLAMPSAEGLFHKAAILSGTNPNGTSVEHSQGVASAVLMEAGLGPDGFDQLRRMPVDRLLAAADAAMTRLAPPRPTLGNFRPALEPYMWGPVVDGKCVRHALWYQDGPNSGPDGINSRVPVMVGTVLNECLPNYFTEKAEGLSEGELEAILAPACGENTERLLAAYRRAYPTVKPIELSSIIYSTHVRNSAVDWSERRTNRSSAPVYQYWFTWHTPVLDGRPRSFHCLDLAFFFNNTDRCDQTTGGGEAPRDLAGRMSLAFGAFARSGNPNHGAIPRWPAFDAQHRPVMIFDQRCEVKNDPDRELRRIFTETLRRYPSLAI